MKWKHWAYYPWLDGEIMRVSRPMESDDSQKEEIEIPLRTLADFLENQPERITPKAVLEIMTDLHQAMNRAHLSGVVHGNLKPSNLLVRDNGEDQWDAWATEFGLWKMKAYVSIGEEEEILKLLPVIWKFRNQLKNRLSFVLKNRLQRRYPVKDGIFMQWAKWLNGSSK